jgi:hypothetical protein
LIFIFFSPVGLYARRSGRFPVLPQKPPEMKQELIYRRFFERSRNIDAVMGGWIPSLIRPFCLIFNLFFHGEFI